jgi:hypothetical protein
MFMLTTTLAGCLMTGGDYGQWTVDVQTFGEDVSWVSPSTVRTDAAFYERYHNVTTINAWVSYLGFEFGPFDVTYMIEDSDGEGLCFSPLPCTYATEFFVTPEPPGDLAVKFDFLTSMDINGYLVVEVENIEFGTSVYDLGWPFGEVVVDVEGIGIIADITVTASDDLCVGDVTGDGVVNTDDVLAVIGGWGECASGAETCPGDATLDWIVDVSDLLWVIGQFGPCP